MTPPRQPRVVDWPAALRRLRAERGWSQARLAAEIGASRLTVWRYETGRNQPSGAYRKLLVELLADHGIPHRAPAGIPGVTE